jgi:alkanesulfonate monooxygenase SsuD/methylene tetrahydromethanopterin reductase-like flavin-dependent oxidoreductase (luciferase family)
MHDIKGLEDLGVVSVGIASSEFAHAAAAQNRSLGYDPAVVFVPHPIQDRTDEEMRALADQAFDAILNACKRQIE